MTMHDCCAPAAIETGNRYDLAVIGAGSAGFSAAITAAELGAHVALIGDGTIGGTCVNTGCVPSKTLIRAVETLHQSKVASRFAGILGNSRLESWRALVSQKDELVSGLRQAKYVDVLPAYNTIAYIEGPARLTPDGVAVNGSRYTPGKTVIATGASPAIPPIPGIDTVTTLDSTTALALETLPRSLVVIGGGFVGCELGQLFARAGVKVTIACRSHLLPQAEPEIAEALARYLQDEGVKLLCGITYQSISKSGAGASLTFRGSDNAVQTIAADAVIVAAGRTPNTARLGVGEAGIETTPNGGIKVDDRLRTTRHGTYAAGDVTGRDMFVYMAAYAGKLAAENALNGDGRRYDDTAMPEVTFTDPQVACVGLTEAAARKHGCDVRAVILPLDQVPRAIAARDTRGLLKLVADQKTGKLLGAHILAPEAGDSIQTAALAIKQGLTVADLAETIFPYLTTVEALKLAALGFTKDVTKLSCCAG